MKECRPTLLPLDRTDHTGHIPLDARNREDFDYDQHDTGATQPGRH